MNKPCVRFECDLENYVIILRGLENYVKVVNIALTNVYPAFGSTMWSFLHIFFMFVFESTVMFLYAVSAYRK